MSSDDGLDVAAVQILGIARQHAASLDGLGSAREDRDAVPAFLAMPDDAVARIAYRASGNRSCGAFNSCRHTISGRDSSSQRSRDGSRAVMPLTLKVAIFMLRLRKAQMARSSDIDRT